LSLCVPEMYVTSRLYTARSQHVRWFTENLELFVALD
jgi:hypothetical protein